MKKFMDSKWGKRIEEAVAFEINFDLFCYFYFNSELLKSK